MESVLLHSQVLFVIYRPMDRLERSFRFTLRFDTRLSNCVWRDSVQRFLIFHATSRVYHASRTSQVFRRRTFPYDVSRRPNFLKNLNESSERPIGRHITNKYKSTS